MIRARRRRRVQVVIGFVTVEACSRDRGLS